jgi:hypothetical protein
MEHTTVSLHSKGKIFSKVIIITTLVKVAPWLSPRLFIIYIFILLCFELFFIWIFIILSTL